MGLFRWSHSSRCTKNNIVVSIKHQIKKKAVTLILTLVVGNDVTEDKMVGHVTRTGEWEM